MQIKIDIQSFMASMPDQLVEVRGTLMPQGPQLFIIAKPVTGELSGKLVVFNLGAGDVVVIDADSEEGKEAWEQLKRIPPASIHLSSIKDSEFIVPEQPKIVAAPANAVPQIVKG